MSQLIRRTASDFLLAALCSVGCSSSSSIDEENYVVRTDSSGVSIVESRLAAWSDSAPWHVSTAPVLQIGVPAGDSTLEFNRIRRVVRLSDGQVVVANGNPAELRLFDRDGRFLRSMGRQGEGPGEFRSLDWIEVIGGDTIIALDGQARRITAFTPDGRFASSVSVSEGPAAPAPGNVRLADGTYVIHRAQSDALSKVAVGSQRIGQTLRNSASLVLYDSSGVFKNTVVDTEGAETSMVVRDGRPAMLPAPFGRNLVHALTRNSVLIGTQDRYEIREYSPSGSLISLIRWSGSDLAVTPTDIQALKAEYLTRARGNVQAEQNLERLFAEIPFPPAKAAYGRLLVDADGFLWVSARIDPWIPPSRWSVFGVERELLGEVRLPDQFDLHEVGSDYVIGTWRDEAGVEYVMVYALVRGARQRP